MSKAAESHGVTLAIKPHVGASVYNTATMLQMLNEIDSPALGANLDTLHIFRAREDASETVRKLGKKIVHVHLREYPDVPIGCTMKRWLRKRLPVEAESNSRKF